MTPGCSSIPYTSVYIPPKPPQSSPRDTSHRGEGTRICHRLEDVHLVLIYYRRRLELPLLDAEGVRQDVLSAIPDSLMVIRAMHRVCIPYCVVSWHPDDIRAQPK